MFYFVDPEVAGGLGDSTVMDTSIHPPVVHELEYKFEDWLGDELLESFPCFIVTESLAEKISANKISGFSLDKVSISTSEEFYELQPDVSLPKFLWLKITGKAGVDDLGISDDFRLVVSERFKNLLESSRSDNASIESFK